ncbi:uncharacterized protein LOC126726485 [Quercus robur]|uniref:uncharacterized protein LOC126726485 n=1 Tax=Quercus robur TaxID=38942 RepID=UPI0021627078|nr:uncharacterized protein LOC126726485 [Quercus robur]
MESTFLLRNAPLPSVPLQLISSPVNLSVARVTVPNFGLNHLTLSLANNSYPRPLRHDFSPIVRAVNNFSTHSANDEGDNKIVRGSVGASLVMACVLGIISCGCWMSPIANAIPPWSSHQTVAADSQKYKQTRQNLRDVDVEALKKKAKVQANSRRDEEVLKPLRQALDKAWSEYSTYGDPHYNIEMALVEVLIYLGRYEEAKECQCLKLGLKELRDLRIKSDTRVPLYKGIIYTMLDEKDKAMKSWKEFAKYVEDESEVPLFQPK